MNFFEVQEFFKNMYPGKQVSFEFDDNCHRFHELVYTDGKPNLLHHVEHRKIKVTVEGMEPIYVPIAPHRECYPWAVIKDLIANKTDVWIHPEEFKNREVDEIAKMSGLTVDEINQKKSNITN